MVQVNILGGYDNVTFPQGSTSQSTASALDWGGALESYTGPTPGWVTPPAVPASGATATNNFGVTAAAIITNAGTQSAAVQVNGVNVTAATGAAVWSTILIPPGGTIKFTYSVAPTWIWMLVN